MGYRAHLYTKKIEELDFGSFNNCRNELQEFLEDSLLHKDFHHYMSDNDCTHEWEIRRSALEQLVEDLKDPDCEGGDIFEGYDAKSLVEIFECWLNQTNNAENFTDPDWIYLSWY